MKLINQTGSDFWDGQEIQAVKHRFRETLNNTYKDGNTRAARFGLVVDVIINDFPYEMFYDVGPPGNFEGTNDGKDLKSTPKTLSPEPWKSTGMAHYFHALVKAGLNTALVDSEDISVLDGIRFIGKNEEDPKRKWTDKEGHERIPIHRVCHMLLSEPGIADSFDVEEVAGIIIEIIKAAGGKMTKANLGAPLAERIDEDDVIAAALTDEWLSTRTEWVLVNGEIELMPF